jgi:hypothetical protein
MTTADEARSILGTVDAAARTTRAARPSRALPLLVLGLVVLGALPFYVLDLDQPDGVYGQSAVLWSLGAQQGTAAGAWTAYYWLLALPSAYAVIAWWHHRAAQRAGVAAHVLPLVLTGLGLLALLLVLLTMGPPPGLGNLYARGLTPLLTIAAGLVVWAVAERSAGLVVVAVVFLGAALTASLYDLVNLAYQLGLDVAPELALLPNLILCSAVLLVSSAVVAVAERRRRARA